MNGVVPKQRGYMISKFDESGDFSVLKDHLTELESFEGITAIMILTCDENGFTQSQVDPLLQHTSRPVFGGIFPAIIHEKKSYTRGSLLIGLTVPVHVSIIQNISDAETDFETILEDSIPEEFAHANTMFVFLDGFARRISSLIDDLFNIFGLETNYMGGGAGSLSFEKKPVIYTHEGLLEDAAVLALTQHRSGIGVSHGWQTIGGPYRVSQSDQNEIISLDWSPAFEIYREVVEAHSGKTFTKENFFDIAKAYPFGMTRLGSEKVVRDPISVSPDGTLTCVGEVPENEYVHILNGNRESLVSAAAEALDLGVSNFGNPDEGDFVFAIDCISRVLFLQEDFQQELEAMSRTGLPLLGALTLGEIANSGHSHLEFYNKTSVIGLLGK